MLKVYRYNWFMHMSIAIHLLAVCLLFVPGGWLYALMIVLANHVVFIAQGLWPRSCWLGDNISQIPREKAGNAVFITIDDGPCPEVTPRVLAILEQHHAQATFFCIGKKVAQYPDVVKAIIAAGHKVENHSMAHSYCFSLWGTDKIYKDIQAAQMAIADVTHARPRYFRAPAGLRNIFLDFVLQKLGLRLVSWTRRGFDTQQNNADKVLARLCKDVNPGDILLLHDANAAITHQGHAVILEVLPTLLQRLHECQLHPQALPDNL